MADPLANFDPEQADNLEAIEQQFAVKAVMQAQTYWTLLERRGGSNLRISAFDDEIYDQFVVDFPEYLEDPDKVRKLSESQIKSAAGKKRWREFMNRYEKTVEDFNFGTLLRLDADGEYDEANTMFSVKIQFYAIEIFRNRHGMNDWIKEAFDKAKVAEENNVKVVD